MGRSTGSRWCRGSQPAEGRRRIRLGGREGAPAWSAAWTAAATSCAVSASMTMFRRSRTRRTTCPACGARVVWAHGGGGGTGGIRLGHTRDCRRSGPGPAAGHAELQRLYADHRAVPARSGGHACDRVANRSILDTQPPALVRWRPCACYGAVSAHPVGHRRAAALRVGSAVNLGVLKRPGPPPRSIRPAPSRCPGWVIISAPQPTPRRSRRPCTRDTAPGHLDAQGRLGL